MSRRRRRQISPQFLQPSSKTSSEAVAPNPPDGEVVIRMAETDDDVIAMHKFLLMVARPAMRCSPGNGQKSLIEIIRVTKYEAALMAIKGGMLVGTMGVMKASWWYGDGEFLTDRWHFVLPQLWHSDVNRDLIAMAKGIAEEAGLEFIHQGKLKERNGDLFMMPKLYNANPNPLQHEGSA